MLLRDRDSWIVATLSVVMWLGISWLFGGFGPITWIVAVLLFLGGVVAGGSRTPDDPAAEPGPQPEGKRGRRGGRRGLVRSRKKSIYGPPE